MKISVYVFCLFVLFACQSNNIQSAIIEEEKMIGIMADVYILEMHYQKKYGSPTQYEKPLSRALNNLFLSHGTTKSNYEKSFEFYASHHEKFIQMNETVIQRYNTMLLEK